jgi:hypothetical protein
VKVSSEEKKAFEREFRFGYNGSGLSFRFVEFTDRKQMVAHIESKFGRPVLNPKALPYAYTAETGTEATLVGTVPEADSAGNVREFVMMVAGDPEDPLTPREARRHWHHEIGHAVDYAAEYVRREYGVADGELPAYLTEFLCDALDGFLGEAYKLYVPESGLPFVLPHIGGPLT